MSWLAALSACSRCLRSSTSGGGSATNVGRFLCFVQLAGGAQGLTVDAYNGVLTDLNEAWNHTQALTAGLR